MTNYIMFSNMSTYINIYQIYTCSHHHYLLLTQPRNDYTVFTQVPGNTFLSLNVEMPQAVSSGKVENLNALHLSSSQSWTQPLFMSHTFFQQSQFLFI